MYFLLKCKYLHYNRAFLRNIAITAILYIVTIKQVSSVNTMNSAIKPELNSIPKSNTINYPIYSGNSCKIVKGSELNPFRESTAGISPRQNRDND